MTRRPSSSSAVRRPTTTMSGRRSAAPPAAEASTLQASPAALSPSTGPSVRLPSGSRRRRLLLFGGVAAAGLLAAGRRTAARRPDPEGPRGRLAPSISGACPDPPVVAGCERVGPVGVLDAGVARPGDQSASGGTDECRQWRRRAADREQGDAVCGGAGRPRRRVGAGRQAGAWRAPGSGTRSATRRHGQSERAP